MYTFLPEQLPPVLRRRGRPRNRFGSRRGLRLPQEPAVDVLRTARGCALRRPRDRDRGDAAPPALAAQGPPPTGRSCLVVERGARLEESDRAYLRSRAHARAQQPRLVGRSPAPWPVGARSSAVLPGSATSDCVAAPRTAPRSGAVGAASCGDSRGSGMQWGLGSGIRKGLGYNRVCVCPGQRGSRRRPKTGRRSEIGDQRSGVLFLSAQAREVRALAKGSVTRRP